MIQVDGEIYRGPRPTAWDLQKINSVLCLESGLYELLTNNVYDEIDICYKQNIRFFGLSLNVFFPPTAYQLKKALWYIQTAKRPVYIHCKAGVDRTGCVVAAYRVWACGWTVDAAIQEMRQAGFHWFYYWWVPFLRTTLKKMAK